MVISIRLPVRDFALPVPREGSIEVNSGYDLLPDGQQIHSRIQKQMRQEVAGYKSEVKLESRFEKDEFVFIVGGRVDSFYNSTPPVIEEIKTSFSLDDLLERLQTRRHHPYRLQLRTYGYMYLLQHSIEPRLRFNLTSICDSKRSIILEVELGKDDYLQWLDQRLCELADEWRLRVADVERRQRISTQISFPFEKLRSGQEQLTQFIEEGLQQDQPIMVQAPTGLGKTAAVIVPTLKNALERGQKLVYVTPKNSQHAAAQDVVRRLQDADVDLKILTMTAKSKMCLKDEQICTPEYCEYARDYYRKVDEHKLVDQLGAKNVLDRDVFTEYGKRYQVCPFELSVDTLHKSDMFVGDYNYVFSPRSLLSRLTADDGITGEKPVLVIDEAHNLPARSTDYYSAGVATALLHEARAQAMELPVSLSMNGQALFSSAAALVQANVPLTNHYDTRRDQSGVVALDPDKFAEQEQEVKEYFRVYAEAVPKSKDDRILEACRQWSDFSDALARMDERFFTIGGNNDKGQGWLKVVCCDASKELASVYKNFSSVVAFSATLKPFDYYGVLSGMEIGKIKTAEFLSPFPKKRRKLLVIPQISTQYKDRKRNYAKVAEVISRVAGQRPGNYMVFFPSYEFLNAVASRLNPDKFAVMVQSPQMTYKQLEDLLNHLRTGHPTLVLAVQGGTLSEGLDFPGDMLIGAFVVGPALPHFNLERETIRAYFDRAYGDGFDFAYTYPAMTRAIQSAGRVIRSEKDSGLIVLMDRRFTLNRYTSTMPSDWFENSVTELVSNSILSDVSDFWSSADQL